MTLEQLRLAWLEGHEIGTHFNGHFCDGPGSVGNWTPDQWESEIDQAIDFVTHWRTNTGFTDLPSLPFDYRKELTGGRTPCLLGQDQWLPTAAKLGFRYDASGPGGNQVWPSKKQGMWDLPLQLIPFPGHTFEVLSMDYNMLANQSHAATRSPTPATTPTGASRPPPPTSPASSAPTRPIAPRSTSATTSSSGTAASTWTLSRASLEHIASLNADDVRMVSFKQYVNWLDAQDPRLLSKLRTLEVGKQPTEGWKEFTQARG